MLQKADQQFAARFFSTLDEPEGGLRDEEASRLRQKNFYTQELASLLADDFTHLADLYRLMVEVREEVTPI
jgi:hypothetical protein